MKINWQSIKTWRWDLIAVGVAALIIWIASTPPSAYFLQIDTAAHEYAALAWVKGCWDFITEKYLSVTILALTYALFGALPTWSLFWLAVASAVSAVLVYEITRLASNAKLAGVLAVLFLLALPAYQFFNRTYFGFLFPFMLLGWYAVLRNRWGWAGLCFGLAIQGHFNSAVPVAISCAIAFVILFRETHWSRWVLLAGGIVLPWALVEVLFFLYLGPGSFPIYTRSTLSIIIHPQVGYVIPPGLTWLPRAVAETNGGWALLYLAPGLFAPLFLRHDKKLLSLSSGFVGLAVFYTLQAGLTQAIVVPRMLMSSLPFWCINAAIVWASLFSQLPSLKLSRVAWAAALLVVGFSVITTHTFIRAFTITPNPLIGEWFERAKAEGRPIRYNGNIRIGMFEAYYYGVETLTNDRRWLEANRPDQAVLIFSSPAPASLSRENYTVTQIDQSTASDLLYPALTDEAGPIRHVELWWPTQNSQPVKPETSSPFTGLDATGYYPGSGCASPPTYMNGTMWYYQLVIYKLQQWLGWA
jgi:hypothetical protein